ncbi:hypothetical protein T4E_11535 [Trichinella pseudospiralis]|uniref:Uncharacterized protein n=1 Tax=Trichinella pseudospiralis TaxID=6337 RepID=A0A0V0XN61_TRIPS|nr:hypothetical protein T4E_11535 [Trichinella pseudospiralis]
MIVGIKKLYLEVCIAVDYHGERSHSRCVVEQVGMYDGCQKQLLDLNRRHHLGKVTCLKQRRASMYYPRQTDKAVDKDDGRGRLTSKNSEGRQQSVSVIGSSAKLTSEDKEPETFRS